jgi:3-oxoacyl-[acyl-carrier protein] reductase
MSRVVIVTGASGGVGRGIALACGQAGWTVWIAARRSVEGTAVADEVTAAGGEGRFVACSVDDPASVDAAIATVVGASGRLDGVAHNATSGRSPIPGHLADLSTVASATTWRSRCAAPTSWHVLRCRTSRRRPGRSLS